MKTINTLFFILACFALNAQTPIDGRVNKVMTVTKTEPKPFIFSLPGEVLIDQDKRQPTLIIKSKLDTVEADYLTESGIFRGSVVKRQYKVDYAAHEPHNGLLFEQVIEILNDKKEPVKKVLGFREILYTAVGSSNLQYWQKFNAVPNHN